MQTDIASILGDATVQEAASLMRYEGVRSLLVVPRDGHQEYGIITFSDIVNKVIADGLNPRSVSVDDIAVRRAISVLPEMDARTVARIFRDKDIGHAPVVDQKGNLLGILSITDLVTEAIAEPD